ncbi:DNA/RNA polymerase [Atractiella rhizophila]|nr:DNA/RNA polymerase [Atractiella rhizophila]
MFLTGTVVVDADAFYASVEELYNPELKGKLFIDLRSFGRGYIDRIIRGSKFGVRSGMAGYIAGKLCPGILMVKPDFKRYSEASKKVMDVLATFDPNYAPASLDEAYLNVRDQKQNSLTPEEVGVRIRERVKEISGLTVSYLNKPSEGLFAAFLSYIPNSDVMIHSQYVVPPDRDAIKEFVKNMPVRKVPGIERVSECWLQALEIKTLGDVFDSWGRLYLDILGLVRQRLSVTSEKGGRVSGMSRHSVRKGKEETTEEYECPVCLKLFQMGLGEFKISTDELTNIASSLVLDLTKDSYDNSIENAVSTKGTEWNSKVTIGTQKRFPVGK